MKFSTSVTGVLCLSLAALSASASRGETAAESPTAKYSLRYKFAMGEVLRYDVRHATHVRTIGENTDQQVDTMTDSVKAWKVTDVLPSGEMEFVHVVEWTRMSNKSPERPANVFDSRKDRQPPRGFEQASRAVGIPLSVLRIAQDGEVTFREEKHPQPAPSSDMPITLRLPKEPIAVGEKWSFPYDVPVQRKSGAKVRIATRRVCKLRDVKSGVATIEVEYQILTPVDAFIRSQLVERLTEGTVRFDLQRGRVLEQEHNVDKRVLGFAGASSSMHFVSRLSEKLIQPGPKSGKIQQASANLPK